MKKQNGITLIALVITIIVLLILAGVSISMVLGESGILNKATKAKTNTVKAGAEEKVGLAVLGSRSSGISLDYGLLEENLNKVEGRNSEIPSPITKESFPIIVNVDGFNIKVKDDGTVKATKTIMELFDQTGNEEDKLHIGDFINYDAGTWTAEEISSIGATGLASTSGNNHQFMGFTSGTSRNENSLAYSYKSTDPIIKEVKNDNSKVDMTGWRVFDISDNGVITLISAGIPEAYQHRGDQGDPNDGYISEYILTGNINESATELNLEDNYTVRDWSMYVNNRQGANNARMLTKNDLDSWFTKYLGIANANSTDTQTYMTIYNKKMEDLNEINAYYWLAPSVDNYSLYCKLNYSHIESSSRRYFELGVRILVTLSPTISIEKANDTKTIESKSGTNYTYNVWNIE